MTEQEKDITYKLLRLVEQCSTGEATPAYLSNLLHEISLDDEIWRSNKVLSEAVHALYHFSSDEDIRGSDQNYDRIQRNRMKEIAEKISASLS